MTDHVYHHKRLCIFKKKNKAESVETKALSWEELLMRVEQSDFWSSKFRSTLSFSAKGFGRNSLLSNVKGFHEEWKKNLLILLQSKESPQIVQIEYERIAYNQIGKTFSRFSKQVVWTVLFDMKTLPETKTT